ncbi:hypothetical protein R5R35_005835 [Gryllus longicercus]|uniref:ASD2 domain-containing protein n=1 Tax=Gryllus longicercus TaxID=2509291 RepID=A0AAN9VZP8_9ORTH
MVAQATPPPPARPDARCALRPCRRRRPPSKPGGPARAPMGLFLQEYVKNRSVPDLRGSPDGSDVGARMARDVLMATRSTPNLAPAGGGPAPQPPQHHHHHHHHHHHASIYSYLHTQSGLNFAPVLPHRQGDGVEGVSGGGGGGSVGTASPPPAPPVRDASSLKGVKYGPGHEKFPSWPVSAAADTPPAARPAPGGGSHRSKSWTDHTNYPKEKAITYTRPYMKRPNPAFTQQLKTVLERCEKIPPEAFESRGEREREALEEMAARGPLYLPRVDREGNELGDIDYLVPSPPERDLEEFAKAGGHAHPAAAAAAAGPAGGGAGAGAGGGGAAGAGPSALTQADLEAYARAYQPPQPPSSYAHSEGYHSYVSSSDSTTTTPFLDRLRRDSEVAGEGRPVPGPQAPPSSSACSSAGAGPGAWEEAAAAAERERDRERPGRDSVVTTSSGSASSSETLKWHGSLSDVSVASSSCAPPAAHAHGATHAHAGGGSRQLIAHSARVQTPQRHHSESVLYLGQAAAAAAAARASHHSHKLRLFPVHTYTVQPPQEQPATAQAQPQAQAQAQAQTQQQQAQPPPQSPPQSPQQQQQTQPGHRNMPVSPTQPTLSVAERISELERQQQQQQQQQQPQQSQLQQQQTRYTYYDPDKRHRVSDPTLKAIQKKALLSFYERHHQGPVVQAGVPSRSHQTTWRSEPHLAQPAVPMPCPPQSPPPPQPPPRPRNGSQSARRASSASDYAGGAWREMTANREPASSETNNMRETARHQHSSSCGSLSTDLLGPVIMGPSISVDDWVPERPPKKPHLRTAFPPPVPDRMASPDLPPPSPPPVLEDEVFATDEPLPPPPPDLRPSDWPFASEHSPEKSQKPSESSSDVPRFSEKESSVKQTDYTNLSPRSSEATQKSQVECSQRHEREVCMPIAKHQESSCQMPRQAENPPSPQRSQTSSSSFQKHNEAGSVCHNHPDNSPCNRQQDLELPNAPLHHRQDSISHNKYPDIPSKEQKHIDSCSISSKHSDTRSPEMSAFVQKYSQNSQRYSENNHHVQRHPETEFSNHRYLENGSTAHPRILETGHAVHRHLETGATMQRHNEVMQRHSENNVNHRHSESNHGAQRHSETSYSLQRPIPQRTVDNDNVPSRQSESYHQGNNSFIQRHSESNLPQKFSESFSSARSFQQEHFNKSFKHDENVSHQFSHNTSHQRHPDIRQYESNSHSQKYCDNESTTHRNQHSNTLQKNYENGISSHNSHGPPSPKKENISMQKCVENGAINQAHMENNMRQFERYHENGCPPPVHRYPEGGGTLNRRYLESNRSLDGSSAMYRYHESNSLGHRYSRPSGMRSTENLHQKCLETPMSKTLDSWTAQKYSTQKLVVNGKLAAPLPDRTVQNGGFTDSLRMSDLDRTNKRNNSNFMSMPARARLQRLPLAVPNGDLPPKPQSMSPRSPSSSSPTQSLSPTGPRSPPHSQMSSPRSVAQGHSTERRHVSVPGARSPPREKGLLPGGPRSPPHSVAGPMMSHIITSSQADSKNQSLGDAAPHIEQSTSKASYIAYRRERDRGLPNFEGSYKRTMSPSERPEVLVDTPASSPVPECDRLSVGESSSAASLEEKDFRASALHACSNACADKTPPGLKEEPPIVMERLDLLPLPAQAPAGRTSPRSPPRVLGREASPDVVPALAPSPAPSPAPPPRVESETQCDLTEDKGGPSPASTAPASPAPDSPPRSPAPAHATAAPSPKVQVTECLQLVQRSEVVLRVNAATSDAASQTEVEQEADAPAPAPAPTPPASPTASVASACSSSSSPASAPATATAPTPTPTPTPALLVRPKTQEELDCERLSLDLASQLPPTDKLQTLLDPEHKKPTDYVTGLFRLDVALRPRSALAPSLRNSFPNNSDSSSATGQLTVEDNKKEDTTTSSVSPLPANSKYFTISESKAKFLNRYVRDIGQLNGVHDKDLHQKKEELVSRLDRKLEVLREERLLVSEESRVNEELGASVAAQVSRLAHPHEAAKYRLHVEEVGKITSLLLALSGRLARAENALMGLPLNHAERKILESKRDKLREQLEEAKKLKENIDRRSISVSNILYKYFNSEEYADYDHFINMKAKLIMDSREIADKIKLGEEQLAALRETLHTPSDC